jgi:hypothetical protein
VLFPRSRSLALGRKHFAFRYASAEHFIDVFRCFYGPTHRAFLSLDVAGQTSLYADMSELLEEYNVAGPGSLVVPGEYLEAAIAA